MRTEIIEKAGMIEWGLAARPKEGETVSGDLQVVERYRGGVLVGVIDGVGHGGEAGEVAQRAGEILREHAGESVIGLVQRCHEALARTRGVVMTVASIDAMEKTVTWMGVGNVEGRLIRAERRTTHPCEHVLLRSGLIGLQLPALQASVMPVVAGDLLVMATDGIRTGFEVGVRVRGPVQQLAEGMLERSFKGTDDGLVLVVRYLGVGL